MSTTLFWVLVIGIVIDLTFGLALGRWIRGALGRGTAQLKDDSDGLPPDLVALDDTGFNSRLRQELAAGRKIEAIKWMRARTGLGLKEAKDAVESLGAVPAGRAPEQRIDDVRVLDDPDFLEHLLLELAAGRKIEAIRLYRERTGVGLKEAKDAVDLLERG